MHAFLRSTRITLEMIKWEHSIFALPFALSGAVLAADGFPAWHTLGWIVLCMVSARSAAMAFNRLVDARLDAANPRTATRAIPAGALSPAFVAAFTVVCAAVFVISAAMLNHLSLVLSPVALVVVLGYSYMKRVTRWSHLVLGLALGIAPAAAWIAVRGALDVRILALTGLVILWVGGFDILYACQDFEHDRRVGLHSIPAAFGLQGAFWIARGMHLAAVVLMFWFAKLFGLLPWAGYGFAVAVLLLLFEHVIVSPTDMKRMNAAFFLVNGIIAIFFFITVAIAMMARG